MSSLIKNAKFGVASALMLASAALIAACGGTGQAEQLDYPENWPAEFAQRVHEEFDGFYNGVDFGDDLEWPVEGGFFTFSSKPEPPPPNEATLEYLRSHYERYMCCFLFTKDFELAGAAVTRIAQAVNENGEVTSLISSSDTQIYDELISLFLSGGAYLSLDSNFFVLSPGGRYRYLVPNDYRVSSDKIKLIPFDEIMWLRQDINIKILTQHYKLGADSPLCDIDIQVGNDLLVESWVGPFEDFCSEQ